MGGEPGVKLTLSFAPNTEEDARAERERVKRLRRLRMDDG